MLLRVKTDRSGIVLINNNQVECIEESDCGSIRTIYMAGGKVYDTEISLEELQYGLNYYPSRG